MRPPHLRLSPKSLTWSGFDAVRQYQKSRRPILYRNQANYLPLKPWLADDESFTREVGHATRPSFN